MNILTALIETLAAILGSRQSVRSHKKGQAYGPRRSKHRRRTINGYKRRRAR